jgi:hypothetical protein
MGVNLVDDVFLCQMSCKFFHMGNNDNGNKIKMVAYSAKSRNTILRKNKNAFMSVTT